MSDINPGSWPDWIAAVGTSLAFIVAAGSYLHSVRLRRESQARLVYSRVEHTEHYEAGAAFEVLPRGARIGNGARGVEFIFPTSTDEQTKYRAIVPMIQVTAVIHNGSKELIGPVKIQTVNIGLRRVYEDFSIGIGTVEPETDFRVNFTFPNDVHPGQPSLGTTIIFRDASGQWWRRYLAEPIEAVHDDPENSASTLAERAVFAANARAMGLNPTADPKPSWRVKWHRLWRWLRGKSPVP